MQKSVRFILISVLILLISTVAVFATAEKEDMGAEAKNVELTVEIFDRAIPGLDMTDGYQATFIKNGLAEKGIDVEFITVPRWEETDKLNILMAAGDAPDLCITYSGSLISSYIQQGGLVDLGPYLEKYGPNIKAYLGADVLEYGQWDGVQYAIPGKRPNTAAFATFVRQDWLDLMGMDAPSTTQEFYKMLVAIRDKNPGKVEHVIPFATAVDAGNIDWGVHTIVYSFVKDMPAEEFASKFGQGRWVLPGYKDGIRFLNKLYNEGLLYPDFALDSTGKQFEKEIIQGNVGSFIHSFDMPYRQSPGYLFELRKIVPNAGWTPVDPFENFAGKHVKRRYSPNGLNAIVPVFNEDRAVEVIKYLDWMAESKLANVWKLQNGEKGVHYLRESSNGIPLDRVQNDDLDTEYKIHWHDFSIITTGSYEYGSNEMNTNAQAMSYPGFEEEIVSAVAIAYTDNFLYPRFSTVIASEAKYTETLNAKGVDIFVKSITASPSDFSAVYDSLVAEYLDQGGQEIIDEKLAAYRASN